MKIAYFINQYPGISHSFIRREIQALERSGVEIVRFAIRPSKDGIVAQEDIDEDERTRHIIRTGAASLLMSIAAQAVKSPLRSLRGFVSMLRIGWRSEAGLARHFLYYGEALVLARWMSKEGLRHVHAHFGTNAATIAMLAAQMAGVSFSFTTHGPEEFEKPALISLKEKIHAASFSVAISKFGASQLKKLSSPEYWPRIKIVRCGIEEPFYENAQVELPAAPHFVCTGRLCAEKGQIDLVHAVALAAQERPDIKVNLIGDGPMRAAIETAIRERRLEKSVALAGWKTPDEVKALLLQARAFVLPTYAEGLPVSIMEALSLRRPVISTYIAGIPELVEDGVCGWLTAAGDVEAIAQALLAASQASKDEMMKMGVEGRRRVKAHHNIDTETEKLKKHFAAVLGQPR